MWFASDAFACIVRREEIDDGSMLHSDEHALALADRFYAAALGTDSWYAALDALATATGSRSGEIITIGANATVPLNVITNFAPEALEQFAATGGGDPAINPRVRAGMKAPILKVLAENDFISPEEHKIHPHYQEFARPWDIPYICLAPLDRRDGVLHGLAVIRSESEGHISAPERRAFASLAPHVRAAIRLQMSLEEQGAALLGGMLESLSIPAFLCTRSGRVQSMTPAAEAIVASGHTLQIKVGQLTASIDVDSKALSDAIDAAADAPSLASRTPRTVIVRSNHPASPALVLDVIRLPARSLEFTPTAQVLIVPQGAGGSNARKRLLLLSVYKLTAAETDVALLLSQGRMAESIASSRSVAIATVRAQIKSILAKLGLTRQIELVARLAQF